ncbi:MAG TPA: lycopene cyclase domain-containing protein [Ktedonobacterales bacterium]
MTYAQFLLFFIVTPLVALGAAALPAYFRRSSQPGQVALWPGIAPVLALMGIATLYTMPWDDHLIALGVWWYRPSSLFGLYIGHVPLEEALFFPLQTLLVGMWWLWLGGWAAPVAGAIDTRTAHTRRGALGRSAVVAVGVAAWIGSLALLGAGWRAGTYVGWEIAWALPPLLLQALVGGDILWRRRRLLGWVVIPVVVYLSCVDALAIHLGIWTIDRRQSLGLLIGARLPVEELLFFLVTSALIGCGLVLGSATESRRRARALAGKLGGR